MITIADVAQFLKDYGLPVGLLILFAYLLLSGRLRTPQEVDLLKSQLAEERADRVKAEARTDEVIKVMESHTELLREIERDILRGPERRHASTRTD